MKSVASCDESKSPNSISWPSYKGATTSNSGLNLSRKGARFALFSNFMSYRASSNLTAQTLYSGILATGSRFAAVSLLAAASAK